MKTSSLVYHLSPPPPSFLSILQDFPMQIQKNEPNLILDSASVSHTFTKYVICLGDKMMQFHRLRIELWCIQFYQNVFFFFFVTENGSIHSCYMYPLQFYRSKETTVNTSPCDCMPCIGGDRRNLSGTHSSMLYFPNLCYPQ